VIVTQRSEESRYWKSKDRRNKKNENYSCYQLNSKEEEYQKRMKKKHKSQPGSQHREE
jgi:hypothetical protein